MTNKPGSRATILLELSDSIQKGLNRLDTEINQLSQEPGKNNPQLLSKARATVTWVNRSFQLAKEMTNDLAGHLRQTEELVRISALLSSSLNVDDVLAEVIDQVISLTGAKRAYLVLYDPETHDLRVRVARNWERQPLLDQAVQFSRGVVNLALERQEVIMTSNARTDSRFNELKSVIAYDLTSIVCIPLVFQTEIVGVLYVDGDRAKMRCNSEDLPILNAFAGQAAIALKNAQLFEKVSLDLTDLQREARRLRIQEATLAAGDVLRNIIETVAQVFNLSYAALGVKRDNQLVISAEYGTPADAPLHVPLIYQGETVGELIVAPHAANGLSGSNEEYLLYELARQAGIAVYAARLSSDLQRSRERLVVAREEERRRLRRDLHDGLGPTIAGLMFKIDTVRNLLVRDPDAADQILVGLKTQIESMLADIRRLVYKLRPPALDELGLIQALREYAVQYDVPGGFETTFDMPEAAAQLPAAVEVAVYMVALEALTNVARHARASHCTVHLAIEKRQLTLDIADDGGGIPADHDWGVGLLSMKERMSELGGRCAIANISTGGACVTAWIPLVEV